MTSTKRWRRAGMAAALIALAPAWPVPAHAAAPQLKTQVPGYYRVMVGDVEVTALFDGTSPMPASMIDEPEAATAKAAARQFRPVPVETATNAYLLNTGAHLVLVDAGAGTLLAPTLGRLAESLKASGYQPEQVDEVYLTHLHPDHIGGLMDGARRVFPNATVRADRRDPDLWLDAAAMEAAPKEGMNGQRRFRFAMTSLNAYVAAGRFKTFDGATALADGIRAIPAPGHTPGHTMYAVESKGQRLLLWGDLVVAEPVQFDAPDVTTRFDGDGQAAAAQRDKVFADAAARGDWVAGAHLSFPGIGHLRQEGGRYVFVPVGYFAPR